MAVDAAALGRLIEADCHHLPLLALSAAGVLIFYEARPIRDVITRLSFATAYPALMLIAVTLLIGPWNLLMGKRTPTSSDLRRDVGIWAGILSIIHTVRESSGNWEHFDEARTVGGLPVATDPR